MTQINLNLNMEQIQDIISNSGANSLAKQMLTTILNQLMEKERDDYIQVDTYSREEHATHHGMGIMNEVIQLELVD